MTEVAMQYRLDEDNSPPIEWCDASRAGPITRVVATTGPNLYSLAVVRVSGRVVQPILTPGSQRCHRWTHQSSQYVGCRSSGFKGWVRVGRQSPGDNGGNGNGKHHNDDAMPTRQSFWTLFKLKQYQPVSAVMTPQSSLISITGTNRCADLRVLINKTQAVAVR